MATLALASQMGLRVGSAPDTFLGAGLQTCGRLIDEGVIGEPVAAVAFMAGHGPESWHPDPAFFYKKGAGPMFDMGPYYLTALVSLLGPVARVSGTARKSFPERIATSEARHGRAPARRGADALRGYARLRVRAGGHHDHELRHLGAQPAAD